MVDVKHNLKSILDRTLLTESLIYFGSVNELKEQICLKKKKGFRIEWISNEELKIVSNFSLGTLIVKSHPNYFDGIRAFAKLTELGDGTTRIDLKTKLRAEFYFLIGIPILAILASLLTDEHITFWNILPTPLIVLWFWFVYRLQEKILFRRVKKYILVDLSK